MLLGRVGVEWCELGRKSGSNRTGPDRIGTVPFDDRHDGGEFAAGVGAEPLEEHRNDAFDLDDLDSARADGGGAEHHDLAVFRVADGRKAHFGDAVGEGVDPDPDLVVLVPDRFPGLVAEGVEQFPVDVAERRLFRDPEHLGLEIALLEGTGSEARD